ncbi:MAG: hypothetical protein QXS03_01530 [Candidatus Micrarchaeaceae archaeon]
MPLVLWAVAGEALAPGGRMSIKNSEATDRKAKEAIRKMLREACSDESINYKIEEEIAMQLYDVARAIAFAYGNTRAYAWSGLAKTYLVNVRVDVYGIQMSIDSEPKNSEEKDCKDEGAPSPLLAQICFCAAIINSKLVKFKASIFQSPANIVT